MRTRLKLQPILVSDTNKRFKFDFDRQLNPCSNTGTKLLAMAIKVQNRKDYSAAAIFLIYSVLNNRNQISWLKWLEWKLGCPSLLVSYSHFSTDRTQYQGKSAMFSHIVYFILFYFFFFFLFVLLLTRPKLPLGQILNHATCYVYSLKSVETLIHGQCYGYCFLYGG